MPQSLTALYLQNPELANALRKRQEGATMAQAGADYSPIQSPWQGLSRLAQALVGGYEQGQADKEIKGVGDKQKELLSGLMAPMPGMGAPMPQAQPEAQPQPMTAPRQPVAQQAMAPAEYEPLIQRASQETGIPANILTGLFAQESGFRPDARNPRSTATGIGQVLDSTAANPGFGLPPLSPEARLDPAQAIPWSARYLAARGQSLGVTDWNNPQQAERGLRAYGENTPEYAQAVMRRAGMAGDMIPAQMPGQGAPPQPRTPDAAQFYMGQAQEYQRRAQAAIAGGRTDLAGIFQQQAQMAQQMAMSRPQTEMVVVATPGSATGYSYVPRDQAAGAPAPEPRPMVSIQNTGESAYERERAQTLSGRVKEWEDASTKSAQTLTRLSRMEDMLNNFTTGAGARTSITAGQLAQRLGVPPTTMEALGINPDRIAQGEAIGSLASQMLVGMIGSGGFPAQGFSNADRDMLERALPGLANSPQGNRIIMQIMKAGAQRDLEIGRAWRDWSRTRGDSLASVRDFQAERLPAIVEKDVIAPILEGWTETTPTAAPGDTQEGATATNPQTGQRLMFRGGQWVPAQ
jgi:hypothetical protein